MPRLLFFPDSSTTFSIRDYLFSQVKALNDWLPPGTQGRNLISGNDLVPLSG